VKILLIAHTCSPLFGSEESVGWNWSTSLSRFHDVTLITHPENQSIIEAWPCDPRPEFHFVDLPRRIDPWKPRHGPRGIHLHYFLWQHAALQAARRLHAEQQFDIVHHVGWGSVSAPPPFWRLSVPFVWGPIGGGQSSPLRFRSYFGSQWAAEVFRSARVKTMHLFPSLRQAVRNCDLLLSTNNETTEVLARAGGLRIVPFLDCGILNVTNTVRSRPANEPLTILWAGRLEARKAPALAIQAFAELGRNVNARLILAGTGHLHDECQRLINSLGLSGRVQLAGRIPWPEMQAWYRKGDVFLFTSLRDSFGSAVLEAMSQGLPVITLNHQGVRSLPADAAFKATVGSPAETIAEIAGSIRDLASNESLRYRMGAAAARYATGETWDTRARRMTDLYEAILAQRRGRERNEDRQTAPTAVTLSPNPNT
jgi:glycosyltransferase involved in cell wall biosynthesis